MRADYTKKSEEFNRLIREHNKFGIPFNVIYCKKNVSGIVLPEILNQNDIRHALKQCFD